MSAEYAHQSTLFCFHHVTVLCYLEVRVCEIDLLFIRLIRYAGSVGGHLN